MTILRNHRGQFIKGCKFWLGKKRPNMIGNKWRTGKKPWNWNGGPIKKHCIICGKDIFAKRCQIKRKRFCSRACVNKYLFRKNDKKNNGKAIAKRFKESEEYKKWRLKIFQRDRFACKWCGYRSKKSKAHGDKESDIHAHHIETIKDNPKLCLKEGNGITLCIKHHRQTYGKEKSFAMVFKKLLRDYMSNIPKG